MTDGKRIVAFYRGRGTDAAGRKFNEVAAFSFDELEAVHDYIQWLFPTAKASAYNPNAPLVDEYCVQAFSAGVRLRARLLKSLDIMLAFYGLERRADLPDRPAIVKASTYADRKANWQDAPAGRLNHNLLRITRIIESLRLLGLPEHAAALCLCVEAIQKEEPEKIPQRTAMFWRQAAGLNS